MLSPGGETPNTRDCLQLACGTGRTVRLPLITDGAATTEDGRCDCHCGLAGNFPLAENPPHLSCSGKPSSSELQRKTGPQKMWTQKVYRGKEHTTYHLPPDTPWRNTRKTHLSREKCPRTPSQKKCERRTPNSTKLHQTLTHNVDETPTAEAIRRM